jgi:hypothetical protein
MIKSSEIHGVLPRSSLTWIETCNFHPEFLQSKLFKIHSTDWRVLFSNHCGWCPDYLCFCVGIRAEVRANCSESVLSVRSTFIGYIWIRLRSSRFGRSPFAETSFVEVVAIVIPAYILAVVRIQLSPLILQNSWGDYDIPFTLWALNSAVPLRRFEYQVCGKGVDLKNLMKYLWYSDSIEQSWSLLRLGSQFVFQSSRLLLGHRFGAIGDDPSRWWSSSHSFLQ